MVSNSICRTGFGSGCFFLTAGHVFSSIEAHRADGIVFEPWQLYDAWGLNATFEDPFPFDIEAARKDFLNEVEVFGMPLHENTGRNYAIIPIPPLTALNLLKNKIRPLTDSAWDALTYDTAFEEYHLFGLPSQFCVKTNPSRFDPTLVRLRVERLENPPPSVRRAVPSFYGKIDLPQLFEPGGYLSDIEGMSGGPIIGMRDNVYHLVAMQVAWHPGTGIIRGIGTNRLLRSVANAVDKLDGV